VGLSALLLLGCYSVSSGPTGYEKRGVWLPRSRGSSHRPKEKLVVGDLEMRFDAELRVYRIVDMPDNYYSAGYYYRITESGWEVARSIQGPWESLPDSQVPPGLTRLSARS